MLQNDVPRSPAIPNAEQNSETQRGLRAGDKIVFTRNLGGLGVVNSERGRVEEIGRTGPRIRLADGRRLESVLDDDRLRHIEHIWTSTDNVIAVPDADSMMTERASRVLAQPQLDPVKGGFPAVIFPALRIRSTSHSVKTAVLIRSSKPRRKRGERRTVELFGKRRAPDYVSVRKHPRSLFPRPDNVPLAVGCFYRPLLCDRIVWHAWSRYV